MEKNVLDILERPFPQSAIKTRPGSFGKSLEYVEGHEYISRLQEAFSGNFSVRILDWKILDDEVVVVSEIEAGGVVKQGIGTKKLTRSSQDGSLLSVGEDLKAALTDSIKINCKLYTIGLHLYQGREQTTEAQGHKEEPRKGNGSNGSNGNGSTDKATNSQIKLITELANKQRISNKALASMIKEIGAVTAVEHLTKRSASEVIQNLMAA